MFKPGDEVILVEPVSTSDNRTDPRLPRVGRKYTVLNMSPGGQFVRLVGWGGWAIHLFTLYKGATMPLIDQAVTNPSYIPDEHRPVQADPTGRTAHEPGAKLDAGKNRIGLVLGAFALALQEVSKVGTFGANKYTDNGWLSVPNGDARYKDALLRHHFKSEEGELTDPESKLLHIAHRCWNDLATLELYLREQKAGTLHAE